MNAYSVNVQLLNDDCLIALKTLADNSVDSVITDPPYGLNFMGKEWDRLGDTSADFTNLDKPHISQESFPMKKSRGRPICETDGKAQQDWHYQWAKECLRVLKPGGFLLAFGGSRTYHRLACAVEDAGFEIRDQIMWVYGSGFPKSLNIGKAVDKLHGNKRIVVGLRHRNVKPFDDENGWNKNNTTGNHEYTKGVSEWEGWGTALKPAHEPIVVARKPLSEKTVVENVLKWGVGGLNIDISRIKYRGEVDPRTFGGEWKTNKAAQNVYEGGYAGENQEVSPLGRFPANFIHDGSQEVLDLFPDSNGCQPHKINSKNNKYAGWGSITNKNGEVVGYDGKGSAARFFYCAKASRSERDKGLENCEEKAKCDIDKMGGAKCTMKTGSGNDRNVKYKNYHPTVKPILLMKYLICLVTPKNGLVLDPFLGSGSTGIAAKSLGYRFVGIEQNKEYFEIAKTRIEGGGNGKC
jgi:site-specific DNA-methyltransferase (adenine-specific)